MLKKATIRKEQEPDFEEKRFNVTIGEDEREFDKENEYFRERGYRITREIREPGWEVLPLTLWCHHGRGRHCSNNIETLVCCVSGESIPK